MSYKVIRNQSNAVVAFGPNNDNYSPVIPANCSLSVEQDRPTITIVPSVVTMRQARLALLQGGYLSTVNAAINAGGEADKITWEYATEVNRNSPLVTNMATALNLSAQDLDNLFTLAASL